MMLPTITTETAHRLPFPWQALWPILSKTDWLNRAVGLPPVTYEVTPLPEGGSSVRARATFFGLELRWEELPFEWVEGQFYRVRRKFAKGPLLEACLGMDFLSTERGSTTIRVFSHLTPRTRLGGWLARAVLGPKAGSDMSGIIRHLGQQLGARKPAVLPKLPRQAVAEQALAAGMAQLRQFGPPNDLLRQFEGWLREASDVELSHIRPLAMARQWDTDRWAVLRLFLQATRCGLLNLSWEILCPNCRSSRQPQTPTLAGLRREAHCDVCQIRFDAQFDQSVELKFSVHPAIRPVDNQTFCLAGPGGKPHVLSQLFLAPNERRAWHLSAWEGAHRLRSPQVSKPALLLGSALAEGGACRGAAVALADGSTAASDGVKASNAPAVPQIVCHRDGFEGVDGLAWGSPLSVDVLNPNPFALQLILERVAWSEDILTAATVASWQEFRDLFAREVISPNEQISVGSQIVLFTDLRGSTAMYCGIGDAPAYALVRDHFTILGEAIRENHGAIVKTIGDAVMGVFGHVNEALAAVYQMQQTLSAAQRLAGAATPLKLKSSLHLGPCLAVNANEKLDYFGTTINLAARLVDCCKGGDLIVSEAMYRRPETAQFLTRLGRAGEPMEMSFRGFESAQRVWRIALV